MDRDEHRFLTGGSKESGGKCGAEPVETEMQLEYKYAEKRLIESA